MRSMVLSGVAAACLTCGGAAACEIYGSEFGVTTKADDLGFLSRVTVGEVYIDAQNLTDAQMAAEAKFLGDRLIDEHKAVSVEIYFYQGKPEPHSADADLLAVFAYTPDPRVLGYRDRIWVGADMTAVDARSYCKRV